MDASSSEKPVQEPARRPGVSLIVIETVPKDPEAAAALYLAAVVIARTWQARCSVLSFLLIGGAHFDMAPPFGKQPFRALGPHYPVDHAPPGEARRRPLRHLCKHGYRLGRRQQQRRS